MMANAVQALDPVTPRPLEDGPLQAFGSEISDEGESTDREELQHAVVIPTESVLQQTIQVLLKVFHFAGGPSGPVIPM